jgi:GNAT superfamily N-acetyltransferase
MNPDVLLCTQRDYSQILRDLPEFWDGRDTHHLHHPMFIHEFRNSAFVIRDGARVFAYLLGFVSQVEPVGYVHLLAVRASARKQGLAQKLFAHFVEFSRQQRRTSVKAITTPSNLGSIAFHKSVGMQLLGEPNADGIPVVPDYAGPKQPRVVFCKAV